MEELADSDEEAAIGGDSKPKQALKSGNLKGSEQTTVGGEIKPLQLIDPFGDATLNPSSRQHLPPQINISLHPDKRTPPDLSPASTQFTSESTSTVGTDEETKLEGKDVESKNRDADKLSALPPPPLPPLPTININITNGIDTLQLSSHLPPPITTSAVGKPRPHLTPRSDLEIASFLLPSSAIPVSRSTSAQPSVLSLGLGNGSGPMKMRITHSATNRGPNPNANLFAWGEPEEENLKIRSRPPIFGPEVVIEDPRIIALHKQVVQDILTVGLIWTVLWIVLCLAVPGRPK